MTGDQRQLFDSKREATIRNMYFNRYLLVRYSIAIFFFLSLFWFLMLYTTGSVVLLMVLPLLILVGAGVSMWEMAMMNRTDQEPAKLTAIFYKSILLVNSFLILASLMQLYPSLFPYLKQSPMSLVSVLIFQVTGILLALINLSRLKRIDQHTDKQYQRIQSLLATLT